MTDFEIDPETNLPKLPKGMFFRVEESMGHSIFSTRYWRVTISIVREIQVTSTKFRKWWGIRNPKNTVTREYQVLKTVYPTKEALKTFGDGAIDKVEEPLRAEDLTPEIILEHAKKALELYRAELKAQALLGDYPPKRLEMGEE